MIQIEDLVTQKKKVIRRLLFLISVYLEWARKIE